MSSEDLIITSSTIARVRCKEAAGSESFLVAKDNTEDTHTGPEDQKHSVSTPAQNVTCCVLTSPQMLELLSTKANRLVAAFVSLGVDEFRVLVPLRNSHFPAHLCYRTIRAACDAHASHRDIDATLSYTDTNCARLLNWWGDYEKWNGM